MNRTRILDASLVGAGTWQAAVLDIPNIILQDLIANPIPTMIGIATLLLIIVRFIRVLQKICRDRYGKNKGLGG